MSRTNAQELRCADFRPEMALLISCCRAWAEPVGTVEKAASAKIDWPHLLHLAQRHAIVPLVHRALAPCKDTIPPPILEKLTRRAAGIEARSAFLVRNLCAVMRLFDEHGIHAVAIKGPALSAQAYGAPGLRQSTDLDILVPPAQVHEAARLLLDRGFTPLYDIPIEPERAHTMTGQEYILISSEKDLYVELGVGVGFRYFAYDLDVEALYNRAELVRLDSVGTVRTPCVADHLLLSCVHGTKHRWTALGWIADVAALFQMCTKEERQHIHRYAEQTGAARMLELGLRLASELLDIRPSDAALQTKGSARAVDRLVRQVSRQLAGEHREKTEPLRRIAFHLAARERVRDRIRYISRLLSTPTYSDWKLIALPARWTFLYYAIRPFRLALKLVLSAGKKDK